MSKSFYITTSIAYINAEPHIGFLFELLAADVLKRYQQTIGNDAYLVTGTDEHGSKVAQAAATAHQEPQAYADAISNKFAALKEEFNVAYDYFIRTTDPGHQAFVTAQWQKLAEQGALKKKTYIGLYCTGCEAFKASNEVADGKCSIHETKLEEVEEENWFLVIDDKVKTQIKAWIESAVYPITRRQEVINILDSGAYDEVSVSRPVAKNSWGIPVPGDTEQIMYVWVDALFNYISALEITGKADLWPADIQIIGKDILKFHAIIWPALLLLTGYELPKKLVVHGFINVDGKKMSKSVGNVITPAVLKERYGTEATRYLLFRQLSFYDDSNFSWAEFDALYNGELANGLGNLVARTIGLAKRLRLKVTTATERLDNLEFEFRREIDLVGELVKEADKLITENELWVELEGKRQVLEQVVHSILVIAQTLDPFMPQTSAEIRRQLSELDSKPLFPRLQK